MSSAELRLRRLAEEDNGYLGIFPCFFFLSWVPSPHGSTTPQIRLTVRHLHIKPVLRGTYVGTKGSSHVSCGI
jgi:hypothetical protein